MGEYYPVFDNGEVKAFINAGGDVISMLDSHGEKFFLWISRSEGVNISTLLRGRYLVVDDRKLWIARLLDPAPTLYGYVAYNLDAYVDFLASKVREKLRYKKVLLSFSGGKDSIASLVVLLKLQEHIPFDLFVVYSYVPYLESLRNDRFIDYIERKLNIDIERVEAPRDIMKRVLFDSGLPFRGYRWCTYLKIKPIRKLKREKRIDFEVSNERLFEASKRFKSLLSYARQGIFISGGQFKPMYPLTILDVIKLNREINLVHPDYLNGCSRISCALCPYRMIYEIKEGYKDVEDPGVIEKALQIGYEKFYKARIDWDTYLEHELWRFHPEQAELLSRIIKKLKKREYEEKISEETIRELISNPWMVDLPSHPIISLDTIFVKAREWSRKPIYSVINPPWKK
ncbi:MAG: phosphoadenosine phosphosulfate reductase domain-containing protein [Candidatus Njordarchaeales archaeon]